MAKKKKVKEPDRVLIPGKPDLERCDNKVVSARYNVVTFLPVVRKESGDFCDPSDTARTIGLSEASKLERWAGYTD
jgi:hypothetical protein